MMDMVRKHCVPGTGNYEAAQACVDRTHEMLRMFKEATRNFVSSYDFLTELLRQHLLVPRFSHTSGRSACANAENVTL
jgi:transposase-like protein